MVVRFVTAWSLVAITVAALATAPTRAQEALPEVLRSAPPALKDWLPWIMADHGTDLCPLGRAENARICAWWSPLAIDLDQKGAHFGASVQVFGPAEVNLPGGPRLWPEGVTANGQAVAVGEGSGGLPALRLPPGHYTIQGMIPWRERPASLLIPDTIAVISVAPGSDGDGGWSRDASGTLWLGARPGPVEDKDKEKDDGLVLKVWRRLDDQIPLRLTTVIEMSVRGRPRSMILGPVIPSGFEATSLRSPLGATMSPTGQLTVQLAPGRHRLEIEARGSAPVAAINLARPTAPWSDAEVWVIEAHPELRQIRVERPTVDPEQTGLPAAWRRLPAYLLKPGEVLELSPAERAADAADRDQLQADRDLWLDESGGGYSVRDHLTGDLRRSWRLNAVAGLDLGSATASGDRLLLTKDGDQTGFEVRGDHLDVVTDGRLPRGHNLRALSFDHGVQALRTTLHLPPGWRLVTAFGVDQAKPTMLGNFTLLGLLLLLLSTLATSKLLGIRSGALAFATVGLLIPEARAPHWLWVGLLAVVALSRVALTSGSRLTTPLRLGVRVLGLAAILAFAFVALPFSLAHIRQGLYPVLDGSAAENGEAQSPVMVADDQGSSDVAVGRIPEERALQAPPPPPPIPVPVAAAKVERGLAATSYMADQPSAAADKRGQAPAAMTYAPTVAMQTGYGVPARSFRTTQLTLTGPVEPDHQLTLWLLPPWLTGLLAFVRVALMTLLALVLLRAALPRPPRDLLKQWTTGAAILVLALLGGVPPSPALAALPAAAAKDAGGSGFGPSAELVEQVIERLRRAPPCGQTCATVSRLAIEATPQSVALRLSIHVQRQAAVPLPGGDFVASKVEVAGQKDPALARGAKGQTLLLLPEGVHQVTLVGRFVGPRALTLSMPLRPKRVEFRGEQVTIAGLNEDGTVEDQVTLSRVGLADAARPPAGATATSPGSPAALAPFVEVTTTLRLGLDWLVDVELRRLSPVGQPLEVHLTPPAPLEVLPAGARLAGNDLVLALGPQEGRKTFPLKLAISPQLKLVAAADPSVVEVWRLAASPLWHWQSAGLAALPTGTAGERMPLWRPWPKESVTIQVAQPEAAPGPEMTIDQSRIDVTPGPRAQDVSLCLKLRASKGLRHVIQLPASFQVESTTIGGAPTPLVLKGQDLELPLTAGTTEACVTGRIDGGWSLRQQLPAFDLRSPSVNADVSLSLAPSRWLLLAGGPAIGPAVLYWSHLLVAALLAWLLGQVRITPLGPVSWFLLLVGLSQVSLVHLALPIIGLLSFGAKRLAPPASWWRYNLVQVALVALSLLSTAALYTAVSRGLLGAPDMQIAGNGSTAQQLRWYADRASGALPTPWILSTPVWVYRGLMLVWSLWLAAALVKWVPWLWFSFSGGGLIKRRPAPPPPVQREVPGPSGSGGS